MFLGYLGGDPAIGKRSVRNVDSCDTQDGAGHLFETCAPAHRHSLLVHPLGTPRSCRGGTPWQGLPFEAGSPRGNTA